MSNVIQLNPVNTETLSLSASDVGAYANYPDHWCLNYFRLPESELNRIHGFIFHFLLSNAAKEGKQHIQWKKPSQAIQAKPYITTGFNASDVFKTIMALFAGFAFFIVPLGFIHGWWPVITYVYVLVAFPIAAIIATIIAGVLDSPTGLTPGKNLAVDDQDVFSMEHALVCRPDRIVETDEGIIPEEFKSYHQPQIGDVMQLAVAMVAIEETYKKCPPYGFLVMGNGTRYKVKNTEALRQKLFSTLAEMRGVVDYLKGELTL